MNDIIKDIQKASQSIQNLKQSFMKLPIHLITKSKSHVWCGAENYNKDFEWTTKIDLCTCRCCLQLLIDDCNRQLEYLPRIITQEVAEYAVEITKRLNEAIKQKSEIENEHQRHHNTRNTI